MPRSKTPQETPLSRNLKRFMEERGVSARQLARVCKVAHTTVADWLNGSNPTQYEPIVLAAEFFGTSLEFLLTGSDPRRTENASKSIVELFKEMGSLSGYARFKLDLLVPNELPKKDGGGDGDK